MDRVIFSFLYGCNFMIYVHNLVISIFNYRYDISNFSVSKITINLSGAIGSILSVLLAHEISCEKISYMNEIADLIYRISIILFLLKRLIGVSKLKVDKIFCISFFTIRTLIQIIHIVLFRNNVGNICKFEDKAKIARWGYIGVDLIFNIFVTVRLFQILKNGITNSKELNQLTERSPKMNNLFNAVNCWNCLQLGSTLMFNSLAIVEIIVSLNFGSVLTIRIFQTLNNILFSYLVTNNKELVKIIAGEIEDDNTGITV